MSSTAPSHVAPTPSTCWRGGRRTPAWITTRLQAADDAEVLAEIAPTSEGMVIRKNRPSVFFATKLDETLKARGADSVICVGGTTSGCVRAAVVDAFSYGYKVSGVSDATFDRSDFIHCVSLFNVEAKYGNVVGVNELTDSGQDVVRRLGRAGDGQSACRRLRRPAVTEPI